MEETLQIYCLNSIYSQMRKLRYVMETGGVWEQSREHSQSKCWHELSVNR